MDLGIRGGLAFFIHCDYTPLTSIRGLGHSGRHHHRMDSRPDGQVSAIHTLHTEKDYLAFIANSFSKLEGVFIYEGQSLA